MHAHNLALHIFTLHAVFARWLSILFISANQDDPGQVVSAIVVQVLVVVVESFQHSSLNDGTDLGWVCRYSYYQEVDGFSEEILPGATQNMRDRNENQKLGIDSGADITYITTPWNKELMFSLELHTF